MSAKNLLGLLAERGIDTSRLSNARREVLERATLRNPQPEDAPPSMLAAVLSSFPEMADVDAKEAIVNALGHCQATMFQQFAFLIDAVSAAGEQPRIITGISSLDRILPRQGAPR